MDIKLETIHNAFTKFVSRRIFKMENGCHGFFIYHHCVFIRIVGSLSN